MRTAAAARKCIEKNKVYIYWWSMQAIDHRGLLPWLYWCWGVLRSPLHANPLKGLTKRCALVLLSQVLIHNGHRSKRKEREGERGAGRDNPCMWHIVFTILKHYPDEGRRRNALVINIQRRRKQSVRLHFFIFIDLKTLHKPPNLLSNHKQNNDKTQQYKADNFTYSILNPAVAYL